MKIFVINCGSSSIKFSLRDMAAGGTPIAEGKVERIGESTARLSYRIKLDNETPLESNRGIGSKDHAEAFSQLISALREANLFNGQGPDAIGHRVVHGGARFHQPALIDDAVVAAIRELVPLAPLHNPANLLGIEICRNSFPKLPQVAVFDTAFHQTLPPHAFRYAVPESWYTDYAIRRYGFHGLAHQYLTRRMARHLNKPPDIITLHLGNGASACAIRAGLSIDTSMGFTPLEGLVMGTRCGDLDPAAALFAAERLGAESAGYALQHDSGLRGLCGSNDMRDILARATAGDERTELALEMFCYRIRKYVGAYFAVLENLDALVFSGGIGECAAPVRERICRGLERLGMVMDAQRNVLPLDDGLLEIQGPASSARILVIAADEEREIAAQTVERLSRR